MCGPPTSDIAEGGDDSARLGDASKEDNEPDDNDRSSATAMLNFCDILRQQMICDNVEQIHRCGTFYQSVKASSCVFSIINSSSSIF